MSAPGCEYRIDGSRIEKIDDLYDQLNDLLMADEDWRLGPSLDALNDVLWNVPTTPEAKARFVWTDHAHSRETLGVDATRAWLEAKLIPTGRFDVPRIRRQLTDLDAGRGKTYFDLVLDVFADHADRIELVLA